MNVIDKISSLRCLMKRVGIDAYLITGADPHLSEYTPACWQTRNWISGFSGSFGRVVVTQSEAVLWTDSRYFLQASQQLQGTGFTMLKDRQPDSVSTLQWLLDHLEPGNVVGVDGRTIAASEALDLEEGLAAKGLSFLINEDLVTPLWVDRPLTPSGPIVDFPISFSGMSRTAKIEMIRSELIQTGAESTLITLLDDLAWLLNLRGNDIDYNPLFMGYGYVDLQKCILFVDPRKISVTLFQSLQKDGIELRHYESIYSFTGAEGYVLLDPDRCNATIYKHIASHQEVMCQLSIPTRLKAIKNKTELEGFKKANHKDGLAMVHFLHWFDTQPHDQLTELGVAAKLLEFRSQQPDFKGESFRPIVGFGPHGAIVHYSVSAETDVPILKDNLLLIDSGGHYPEGTTDMTRTIPTGTVPEKVKREFTLVLKGMIQLANAIFPESTKGHSLDILARKALWDNGMDYGHGTAHGIGHYLCVHEGPMSIRQQVNPIPIAEGQVLSNEPGLYREGEYGIRTENMMVCVRKGSGQFGNFLGFEVITFCPIDRRLIVPSLLTPEEREWLNHYHERVYRELSPDLDENCREWLATMCLHM